MFKETIRAEIRANELQGRSTLMLSCGILVALL